ncbi:Wadjet anti-phage system protein JetD domain-containing protein [Bradyrhizobium sp. URHD0069]|uniref:Wadjet anti-phage system protein JetD domain-containing protein n=1 Tax=Bradyrhizobium sp. URHD0069 TaxID=1380355 RepID=UPI00068F00DC|nr:Wadjet anti-phage system protein JetD domain-containing protein [Bradyrhizobium sp. URHD0069]
MTDLGTADAGVEFLERLLERSERHPDRSRPAFAAPEYDKLSTVQQVGRFHDLMAAAERFGAVEVQRGRRDRGHLIERVRVRDPDLLARHLGRPTAAVVAQRARDELLPIATSGEAWVVRLLDEMAGHWARSESAYRLAAAEIEASKEFFMLLASISRLEARGLDARTFSLRATNDTKAFDRHASRLATVVGIQFGQPGAAADAIWASIGLERYSHPIHLKRPVIFEGEVGVLVDGNAAPFASVHPEMLPLLKMGTRPSFVLTVENYASFNRQVREMGGEGLIVYLGGFPSAGVVSLLNRALSTIGDDVPFFHWGDIDPGGLKIFRFLEQVLPRRPRPHLMNRKLVEEFGKPAMTDNSLRAIGESDSSLAELAMWMSTTKDPKILEQEAPDPRHPPVGSLAGRIEEE